MHTPIGRYRSFKVILFLLAIGIGHAGLAQSAGEDPIGFKGGYKAFSRLCETNLAGAASLLANDFSRGYFVSLTIPAGADTVTAIAFLTAAPPEIVPQITWALKSTNGQWVKKEKARKLLIPIFFCQRSPGTDPLASQLLVANNVGFNLPGSPDEWPEAAEGTWLHPLCPLIPAAKGQATAPFPTAGTTAMASPTTPPASTPSAAANAAAPATATTPPASTPSAAANPAAPATATTPSTSTPSAAANPAAPAATMSDPSRATLAVPDSTSVSGIYRTRADYDAGMVTYASTFAVEEKTLISWGTFDYVTAGTIRVRTSPTNKDYQEFPAGSIYGFRSGGIRYIYMRSGKQYLSVIYMDTPILLFMAADKQASAGNNGETLYGVFMYAKTLDGPLKEFTRKRIDEDFGSNPTMAADLQVLRKNLNQNSFPLSKAKYEMCRQLAQKTLINYAR